MHLIFPAFKQPLGILNLIIAPLLLPLVKVFCNFYTIRAIKEFYIE